MAIETIVMIFVHQLGVHSMHFEDGDNIDSHLDRELELLTMINVLIVGTMLKIDQFYITLQFKLAIQMSPCMIWIQNIHDLNVN